MTEELQELGCCSVGSKTEQPCPFPAVCHDGAGRSRFCERHLAAVRVNEMVGDIEAILERYQEEVRVGKYLQKVG